MARKRLLILDDDPPVRELIHDIAESVGVPSQQTSIPSEFFRLTKAWEPTHIILDLNMPEMDGIEVMKKLARDGCQAAIIVISGVGERVLEAAARTAVEAGLFVVGVLAKPFTSKALLSLLSNQNNTRIDHAGDDKPSLKNSVSVTADLVRHAIRDKRLVVYFQPTIECTTNRLVGFEALSRICHPDAGLIQPNDFIPVAEQERLIGELTREVLSQSLGFLNHLRGLVPSLGIPHDYLRVAVNISAQILSEQGLVEQLSGLCKEQDIAPERVIFELTESSALEDPEEALVTMTRLRMRGFHLAMDDFGMGYSSLRQLLRLPLSVVKIDKSFVESVGVSEDSQTVVNVTIALAHNLGLRTVAEGIESHAVLELVKALGCDMCQGYYVARPLPQTEVMRWIETACRGGFWIPNPEKVVDASRLRIASPAGSPVGS